MANKLHIFTEIGDLMMTVPELHGR